MSDTTTCTHCQQPLAKVNGYWMHLHPPVGVHPATPSQLPPRDTPLARLRLVAASGAGLSGDVLLSDLGELLHAYDRLRAYAVHPPRCQQVAGRGACDCGLAELLREDLP